MMDLKFILDLKDHPTLAAGFDAHEKGKAGFNERNEFLKRSLQNLHDEAEKYEKEFWDQVAAYAREKDLLSKDVKIEECCFHYQEKHRQVFMHDKSEHSNNPIEAILNLLGKGK